MWFKNLQLFRFKEPFELDAEQFSQCLADYPAKPCSAGQLFTYGWVNPFKNDQELFVHAAGGYFLFAACREEKVLPAAVVRQALEEKVGEIELQEDRKLSGKQKRNIKEEIEFTLLQQAFTKKQFLYAYIDTHKQLLCVDTSSRNKAEEFTQLLRKAVGRLPIVPVEVKRKAGRVMTSWVLEQNPPGNFELDTTCEMVDPEMENSVIKCIHQNLASKEITSHLQSGMQVSKLALSWSDRLSLVVDESFSIKRLRFLDLLQEQRKDVHAESKEQQIDADFTIMTLEFSHLLDELFEAFGGLVEMKETDMLEEVMEAVAD